MKFFVPAATDDANAESIYDAIKQFNSPSCPITKRRIFAINSIHKGKKYYAEVGKEESAVHDLVLAILETDKRLYYVCTTNHGGVRGEPILVGQHEVTGIVDFD